MSGVLCWDHTKPYFASTLCICCSFCHVCSCWFSHCCLLLMVQPWYKTTFSQGQSSASSLSYPCHLLPFCTCVFLLAHHCHLVHHYLFTDWLLASSMVIFPVIPNPELSQRLWSKWRAPPGEMLCPGHRGYTGECNRPLACGVDNLGNKHPNITIYSSMFQPY